MYVDNPLQNAFMLHSIFEGNPGPRPGLLDSYHGIILQHHKNVRRIFPSCLAINTIDTCSVTYLVFQALTTPSVDVAGHPQQQPGANSKKMGLGKSVEEAGTTFFTLVRKGPEFLRHGQQKITMRQSATFSMSLQGKQIISAGKAV